MDTTDPVLIKFRKAVGELYGDNIERVVLYGSRARGDARPDSDYDIAIFLNHLESRWDEGMRVAEISLKLLEEHDAFISPHYFEAGMWRHPSSPLMFEIRKDGVDL